MIKQFLVALALITAIPGASAQNISLLGTWEIVEAQPAPWTEESQRATHHL